MEWNFACPDWIDRLRSGRSLVPDLPLDKTKASRAVAIFNRLKLPDVVGTPKMEVAAGEWFRDIVRAVFGSVDANGVRHVPRVFALVPKKNSKTTGGAGIMLTALLLNVRPRAEFLLIGPTQAVADTAFQQAVGMIEADEFISKRLEVTPHLQTIKNRKTKATLKIKTFDMKVVTGSKPVGVLVDELHVMSNMSYATRVFGQLTGGMIANPEAFLIVITTQSDQTPAGIFKSELNYARKVRDGKIGQGARVLPILYEFPEAMQKAKDKPWLNPKYWPMVLPNLGLSITIDRLISDFNEAKEKGAEEIQRWASQHLNLQVGVSMHDDRWQGVDYWEGATDPDLTLDVLLARCEVAVVGIDGGGADDLLGLCVAGRDRETKHWLYWFHAWADRKVLEIRKEIAESLTDFEKEGDLTFCDFGADASSLTPDIDGVVAIVKKVRDSGILAETNAVGLDPQGVGALVDALDDISINGDRIHAVPQGYRLSSAIWSLERKLRDGTARHGGQLMMGWCVSNAKVVPAGNAVLITKQASGKCKIDPLCAGLNATKLLELNPAAARSVYETRGVRRV